MAQKTVITIPAHHTPRKAAVRESGRSDFGGVQPRRRVAGYARVSTDHTDQGNSFCAQVEYYSQYIRARQDWLFVGVYTDEGITGTSTKHREGFNRMVADALGGRIDLIVTKSVSRFARNTVDSLSTIRRLKEAGVEVYFQKEDIWTMEASGELLITIMSSLAQEESRSISENVKWGCRKRFADGRFSVAYSRFLGYERGPQGEMVINREQAETVRLIYRLFLGGTTLTGICRELQRRRLPSPTGQTTWYASSVRSILTNEKYKGDALLQKRFVVDFLTKRSKRNEGEVPQYYVEGSHEAIIEPELFDRVQEELARRGRSVKGRDRVHPLSGRFRCADCGGFYGPRVLHSTDKYRKTVWMCNRRRSAGAACKTPTLSEEQLWEAIRKLTELVQVDVRIRSRLTGKGPHPGVPGGSAPSEKPFPSFIRYGTVSSARTILFTLDDGREIPIRLPG